MGAHWVSSNWFRCLKAVTHHSSVIAERERMNEVLPANGHNKVEGSTQLASLSMGGSPVVGETTRRTTKLSACSAADLRIEVRGKI